jgi:predicted glycoside hydrolase/deacetylase ChbG (UPF0249 family)
MTRELIVVADDLGLDPGTNRAILRAHREGIVTAASLLVGMPTSKGAACGAREQGLALGLHLRLTTGQPLSDGPREVGLADDDGFLSVPRVVLRLVAGGAALEAALRSELRAQMQAFLELVPRPDHINSHHHLHLHPAVLGPFLDAARELGFPAVRWPEELASGAASPVRWAEIQAFRVLARRGRARLDDSGLKTSDHFRGLSLMDGALSADGLCAMVKQLPAGCTELMCHPGESGEGREGGAGPGSAGSDLDALISQQVRDVVESEGVVLRAFATEC